jgi:hypothetical protein
MAVATGSQIRPELSAVDYTPFLQAAGQSAQMQAQGIASFASGVSQGIQNFLKKQEEKQNEQEGIAFIKSFDPSLSDEAAKAGYKAAGGAAAYVKFKTDMAQAQLTQRLNQKQVEEMERALAEKKKLDEAMRESTAPAAVSEMMAGVPFEKLSTGPRAFTQPSTSTADFVSRAQRAGISPTTYAPVALTLSQVEENLSKAEQLRGTKPESVEMLRFRSQMAEKEMEARVQRRADQIAFGKAGEPLLNAAEELRAQALASKQTETGERTRLVEKINPDTGEKDVYKQTLDISGNLVSEVPQFRPHPTPKEQAAAAELVALTNSAVKWMDAYEENLSSANIRVARNQTALKLLESGQVKTGPAATYVQAIRRLMSSFGGDPKTIDDTAKFGVVVNILGDQLINYFQKTKGAISDYETKYFARLAANENKTPEENIAILKMAIAIDERSAIADKALNDAKERGEVKGKIQEQEFIRSFLKKNPIDFDALSSVPDPVVERNLPRK